MRIAESHATALTIRHPRVPPETKAAAPAATLAVAPLTPLPARLAQYGTPDAGFIMQLIATATASTADEEAERPARNAASVAYGYAHRTTQPLPSGNRIIRSI